MSAPTALYRHFDGDGRLLYVGISASAPARLAQHVHGSHWSQDIRRVDVEMHSTREAAEAAERAAIRDETPAHNKRHGKRTLPDVRAATGLKCSLAHYLKAFKVSQQTFAELGGWRQATVSDWVTRRKTPSIRNAIRIERLTGGAVSAASWASADEAAA